jgi:hypothetical protein
LIGIAHSKDDSWQEEAIKQAKEELKKRGISEEEQGKKVKKWEKEIENQEKEYQKQLEKNAIETYRTIDLIAIFILSPFILLGKFRITIGMTLSELKEGNYKIKYKQRLISLIGGLIFYVALIKILAEM